MSGGKMPTPPASATNVFSSTPLKTSRGRDLHRARSLEEDVSSCDDDDTYSLLSPIYHDSFDSDEDHCTDVQYPHKTFIPLKETVDMRVTMSPIRCELPKDQGERASTSPLEPAASPTLSPWEKWLVNKAKDDRLKLEKKAEEECILKEKNKQQARVQEEKRTIVEEKIQEWLKLKRKQDQQEKQIKQSKEQEQIQRQQAKQRETERRAQEKYREWLQKKNQEKMAKEKREKEEAARKKELDKERRKRAEEKFKEWLANEKGKASPKSSYSPKSPYDKAYPSPSYCNPIPWKPLHIPPPETMPETAPGRRPQSQPKYPQKSRVSLKFS